MPNVSFGTLNLHRADCDRKHAYPCDPWTVRAPRIGSILNDLMRCSVYAWTECMPQQAADNTQALGWGSAKNPPYVVDENQNCLAWDRAKWTDLEFVAHSLSDTPGDTGDINRRSVLWGYLQHLDTKARIWFGVAHLETGDPPARVAQAAKLVSDTPDGPSCLGIDRNSFDDSDPAMIISAELESLRRDPVWFNPGNERSFHGWTTPVKDGKCVDGIHTRGVAVVGGGLISTVGLKATDHSGIRVTITVAAG